MKRSSFPTRFSVCLTGFTAIYFLCLYFLLPKDEQNYHRKALGESNYVFLHLRTLEYFVVAPFILVYLLLLFRILSSTAEDYFSPPLEMFSFQLHLPPRLAGVTLLALGNGASDVAATIKSMMLDPIHGYEMSIGALTGAGMFVSTIIVALVIQTAQGVHCRGAFVREVGMYFCTNLLLWIYLGGSLGKKHIVLEGIKDDDSQHEKQSVAWIDHKSIHVWTLFYVLYLGMVFFADVYHKVKTRRETVRTRIHTDQSHMENRDDEQTVTQLLHTTDYKAISSGEDTTGLFVTAAHTDLHGSGTAGRASLNFDDENDIENDDDDIVRQQLILHGSQGFLIRHYTHPHEASMTHDHHYVSTPFIPIHDPAQLDVPDISINNIPQAISSCMQLSSSYSYWDSIKDGYHELNIHFRNEWHEILDSEDFTNLDKFLLVLEFPFTVVRQLTIPIPCEDVYCKPLVAISIFISPVWLGIYAYTSLNINLFFFRGVPYILIATIISTISGLAVLRYAPPGNRFMPIVVSAPIALFGFFVAASWIDTIAGNLVNLLSYLGTILDIPKTIMGVTVLALGNSMSDLSADVALARKGLANMAITACFAGPMFNILIGLSAGFSSLLHLTNSDSFPVVLNASNNLGFIFIMAHCLIILAFGLICNQGFIPSSYGYVALGIYGVYMIFCLAEGKETAR